MSSELRVEKALQQSLLSRFCSELLTLKFAKQISVWRAREESNLRHPASEAGALSTELLAQFIKQQVVSSKEKL